MNEIDNYTEFSPPKYLGIVGTIAGIAAFAVVASVSKSSAPFFSAISVAVITMLIGLTWPLRQRRTLWVLILAVAIAHIFALVTIPWPKKVSYGILFAPLIGLEILVLWRGIVAILKATDPDYRR